jgi:hypothetical protein
MGIENVGKFLVTLFAARQLEREGVKKSLKDRPQQMHKTAKSRASVTWPSY